MRKYVKMLILLVCLAAVCVTAASAEEYDAYYYVSNSAGEHHNDGMSPRTPLKTFTDVSKVAAASEGGCVAIVFMDAYTLASGVNKPIAHDNTFVYTTHDGVTDYAKENGAKIVFGKSCVFQIAGPTKWENISFEYKNSLTFVANYHAMAFGENIGMNKLTAEGNGIYVYGGYRAPNDSVTEIELDTHLSFASGAYYLVVGGSRNLGKNEDGTTAAGKIFEGTHYIDIMGGDFNIVYGGSHANHASHSAVVRMTGGTVGKLAMAGDQTRRLNGDATAILSGGEIQDFQVNNVLGEANITMNGTTFGKTSVLCYNDAVAAMEAQAGNAKRLFCDANCYTAAEIAILGAEFDTVETLPYFYIADATSFVEALEKAEAGARLILLSDLTLTDFAEPRHGGKVEIVGGHTLTLYGSYTLGGDTVIGDVTLAGDAAIDARGGMLTVRKDAKVVYKPDIHGSAALFIGNYGAVTEAKTVIIDGADVDSLVGGTDAVDVEIRAGQVTALMTAATTVRYAKINISGGRVGKLTFRGVTESLALLYCGGSIASAAADGACVQGTLTLGDRMAAGDLGNAAALFTKRGERVVYARDGGKGNGYSPASPASFRAAYELLRNGGTLVVVGEVTGNDTFYKAPLHSGKITITSVYNGVDYRKTADAKLVLARSFYFGGDTEVDHISLVSAGSYAGIFCCYYDVTFGSDITSGIAEGNTTYPCIITGAKGDIANKNGTVVINGGDWQRLRLGNSGDNPTNITTSVVMNGGTVHEYVIMVTTSHRSHIGNGSFQMNGGVVKGNIYGAYYSTASTVFCGDLSILLSGGTVHGGVYATKNGTGVLSGSFTVTVRGGDLSQIPEIVGTNTETFKSKLICDTALPTTVKVSGF